MSQDDQTVANADGATVRADINSNLQALASSSSGASTPTTTWPNQFWFDTTGDELNQRNEANTAWVVLGGLVGNVWTPWFQGVAQGPWSRKTAAIAAKSTGFSVVTALDGLLYECDVSGGGFTATLPAAATLGNGFLFGVKTTGHATNAVTIDPAGAEQIEGTTTRAVSGEGAVEWFRCTGTKFVLTAIHDPDIGGGAAKAWVHFDATGSIWEDVGVTSITDNAVGDWSINLSTAMATANYAVIYGMKDGLPANQAEPWAMKENLARTKSTIACHVICHDRTATAILRDPQNISVAIFGDQ